mmetsp:Transcript_9058/g.11778  ORF Transcript_9058/g.11778 Transcript_9058/m.11778 type:complete len:81 (-) Transcript_9058:82-324(-)
MVLCCFGEKYPSMKRRTRQLFPTPLSPNTTTLNSTAGDAFILAHPIKGKTLNTYQSKKKRDRENLCSQNDQFQPLALPFE